MLVAAALCPCPPLLVPEVAAGAAGELDPLRAACREAVDALAAARPDRLVVVGPTDGAGAGPYPQGATGSFRGFGVDQEVGLGTAPHPPGPPLPPSLSVGAWLLAHATPVDAPVTGLGVDGALAPEDCLEAGRELAASAPRVALLVMGDGSACRTVKAPGYHDERAADYDAALARALATADTDTLAALTPALATTLQSTGRAPWQLLTGAARASTPLRGTLRYDEAPYGVGYFVASWG
ncbi:class III extradiol dioxygenase subunit B-like domain-containing protein [Streptomyces catenulae]|uniref:Class III extradiol dioxygenase subunit B-like domain-containing protein n=1 Tax=Streptomyces catenulae TaxID=66875 RepID=A0ABV2Z1B3_9ACTN|nr:class III extradiol dioxygenase subunit B-like domain-containing protein [Streptomyces catenulae]